MYALGQVGGYQRVHKRRSLVGRYLDARKVPMGAAAYLGKACVHKRILGMLDGSKLFGSNGLVVGDAACKARVRGFVPGWKAKLAGQGPNIGLRQARRQQRAVHFQLVKRLQPRAVIAQVAGVGAFCHVGYSQERGLVHDAGEQCAFAEVASICGVFGEAGYGQGVDVHHHMADASLGTKLAGFSNLSCGDHLRAGGDGDGVVAKHVSCNV